MSDIILKIENLSKQYRLGTVGTGTLSHDLNRWWYKVRGKEDPFLKIGEVNKRDSKGKSDYVWALKDINLEVKKGEVLGIIGKNGAGKSTLLKILSKVTGPTTGSIKSRGRIASLLEVGTGFHPELTGKENIFLNGAILGMTKKEINTKLDEIVSFAGVERYIDTPVKRYSSGMKVRLAFAVAAHLEPDILVVDEVLAVGDAEFQKKAIGKMQDISTGEGRTVLFVSHNMAAVKSLCTRGIVLVDGEVSFNGAVEKSINHYLKIENNEAGNFRLFKNEYENKIIKLKSIGIRNVNRTYSDSIVENFEIEVLTDLFLKKKNKSNFHITFHLFNELGEAMFSFYDKYKDSNLVYGENKIKCTIPSDFFQSGNFSLSIFIIKDSSIAVFYESKILNFTIADGEREVGVYMGREPGFIKPTFKWNNYD